MSDQQTRERRQRKRKMANKKHRPSKRFGKPSQYGAGLREHPVASHNWGALTNDD